MMALTPVGFGSVAGIGGHCDDIGAGVTPMRIARDNLTAVGSDCAQALFVGRRGVVEDEAHFRKRELQ